MDNFSLQDFSTDNGISRPTFSVASNNPKKRTGRKKLHETRHPVYRGVRLRKPGKWVCEIREPNKKTRIWLGTYATADMAARAHDVAAIALRGSSACLNFADSAWRLPVPASADAESIQKAAAEAAKLLGQSSDVVEVVTREDMMEETTVVSPEKELFTDEDDLFGMTSLINNLAEGLMLPPPYCMRGDDDGDVASYADVSLWTYSI